MNETKSSVKALKKQMAAAIAMVTVAAVAVGSSTYAWFANNNRVSATGMSVQATAEGGIEIKAISGTQDITPSTQWATLADAQMNAGTILYPTSTKPTASNGVLNSDWYHASAQVATNSAANANTYAKLQQVADTCTFTNGVDKGDGVLTYSENKSGALSAGAYYLATTYNIAYVGKNATDLKVEGVTVTGNDNNAEFDKSLRVAIACGSNVALYAPGYDTNTSYKVCTETTGTPVTPAAGTMPDSTNVTALAKNATSTTIAQSVGAESNPTVVNVYIWFEGEDSNHFTNNLNSNVDTLKVTVNFSATI